MKPKNSNEVKPREKWPLIMETKDIMDCLGCTQTTAIAILKYGPVLDPSKRHYRQISKRELIRYLEG